MQLLCCNSFDYISVSWAPKLWSDNKAMVDFVYEEDNARGVRHINFGCDMCARSTSKVMLCWNG